MSADRSSFVAAPETMSSNIDPEYVESRSVLSIRLQELSQFLQQGREAAISCDLLIRKEPELARVGGESESDRLLTASTAGGGSWVAEGDTVVHWRAGAACFTRVCARHQCASLTVGERWLLDGWTCELCAAEIGAERGIERYRNLHKRLAGGHVQG